MASKGSQGSPVRVDLVTTDTEGAQAFYGPLLGWTVEDGRCYADGTPVASLLAAGQAPVRGWRTSFDHPDLQAAAAGVRDAGGEVLAEGDGVVHATDPGGATFAVVSGQTPVTPGPGRPSWYELMTTDAATADAFYGAVFGHRVAAPDDGPYALFTLGERPVAGRLSLPPDLAGVLGVRWMVYFAHADVDAGARQAEELGGAVLVPPRDTPPGRVAALRDPTGGVFTVLRPAR